tara:strand:- start:412 stop:741 length:330 start_codon:yes stop_codon:yes gene_type:complete
MKEVREFVDTYNRHFLLNYKAEELVEKKNIDEAIEKKGTMVGKYKVAHDFMSSEFGFVNDQAMKDNEKKVGGNKGVQDMIKKGMSTKDISQKFGMYHDAVKLMAKGKSF